MLIAIEGIDGCGKSTVWDRLHEHTDEFDQNITFTREPTDSRYGELLRENLSSDTVDPLTELFLFMADHSNHINQTVRPAIERGDIVITDRYLGSRCAYQAYTLRDVLQHPTQYIYDMHTEWSMVPDLTLYLDVGVETAFERLDTQEKYETKDRLEKIQSNYEHLQEQYSNRYMTIDAEQSKQMVVSDCIEAVDSELSAN